MRSNCTTTSGNLSKWNKQASTAVVYVRAMKLRTLFRFAVATRSGRIVVEFGGGGTQFEPSQAQCLVDDGQVGLAVWHPPPAWYALTSGSGYLHYTNLGVWRAHETHPVGTC